jgi:hypothetical protein
MDWSTQVEWPAHQVVEGWQRFVMGSLLSAPRLRRMVESQIRYGDGEAPYTIGEMFETLTGAVWSELGGAGGQARNVASFRRNLQRVYVDQFLAVMMGAVNPAGGPVPDDASALARHQLTSLASRLDAVMCPPPCPS